MRYRNLGDTGLKVSEISFGTIPILSGKVPVLPAYYSPDEETAVAIMTHAFNLGCNFYDTAIVPEYGDAEVKLGKFALAIGRDKILISDKARFFDGNEMYKAVEQSCENLGTTPDLYFVHQVDYENSNQVFSQHGAVAALADLRAEGKIKWVGIASHYYDVLLQGAKDKRVQMLQGSGNILERGMLERIGQEPLFRPKGIIVNKVYAAGILPGVFPTSTLLAGVLSYPISTALIGLGTIEQVDVAMGEAVEAENVPFEQVIARLEKDFTPIPCDRCQRCYCSQGTEIHTIFRQYNYYFLGKNYWALRKLNLGINESAASCRSCTDLSCLKQCPLGLNIPRLIQMIQSLVAIHIRKGRI